MTQVTWWTYPDTGAAVELVGEHTAATRQEAHRIVRAAAREDGLNPMFRDSSECRSCDTVTTYAYLLDPAEWCQLSSVPFRDDVPEVESHGLMFVVRIGCACPS